MENGIDVKKISIIAISVLALVIVVFGFFYYNRDISEYMIVKESLILTKKGGRWKKLDKIKDDVLKQKYHVFYKDGEKSNVMINYNEKINSWHYLDENYADLDLKWVGLAYTSMFKGVKNAHYDISRYSSEDDGILKEALGNRNIDKFSSSLIKSTFDLDGDGTLEVIYTLTNNDLSARDYTKKEDYSRIFLVRNSKFIKNISDDIKQPYLVRGIIDIDKDGVYEVIVSKGDVDVSTFESCYQIYKIEKDNIKLIMDCK